MPKIIKYKSFPINRLEILFYKLIRHHKTIHETDSIGTKITRKGIIKKNHLFVYETIIHQ